MKSSKTIQIRSHCILAVLVLVGLMYVQSTWAEGPLYCFDERRVQHHYKIAKKQIADGEYLNAYINLSLYWQLAFEMGIFTKDPGFKQEIDKVIYNLESDIRNEIKQARTLRDELQQCKDSHSSKGGIYKTKVSDLTIRPDMRLRDNPPSLK